ncbi:winged helix-turn-helix transcriptional regulator [Agromyces sp. SYSU K20354]|uniref:arsenate reductase/protein-tyrosine-phosphatase family protein n=1 Tax=Agromyces cavernae TaxID=2898659 RepID=UPI001E56B806|nr:winged helix-turn-helix transcriptional regulator [Agromyces cavernae]MCD2440752.1 winged helix-turn-helix transcriptional regulator [Agromyces cavernae]
MDRSTEARRIRLLTDPIRLRMLGVIRDSTDGRTHVGRLVDEVGVAQPTVSGHISALVSDGVIECSTEGGRVWCSIAPSASGRVDELLQADVPAHAPDEVLARVASELADRFEGVFAPETVGRYVRESHDLLAARDDAVVDVAHDRGQRGDLARGHSVRDLAAQTAQWAADRLVAVATARSERAADAPIEVLFVCVQNSGRSQLGAAILKHLAGDRVHVRSAGSRPAGAVRSTIIEALDEIGAPVGSEFPKPLTDEVVRAADLVITMGCGDACPVYPGRRYLDWELDDPDGQSLARVRTIRDDVEQRVRALLDELGILREPSYGLA